MNDAIKRPKLPFDSIHITGVYLVKAIVKVGHKVGDVAYNKVEPNVLTSSRISIS